MITEADLQQGKLSAEVRLSIHRALFGAVPATLRSVTFEVGGDCIKLCFIFDGPIDPDDEEGMRIVGTEVIADFNEPMMIEEQITRLDYPDDLLPHELSGHIYQRKERTSDGKPLSFRRADL